MRMPVLSSARVRVAAGLLAALAGCACAAPVAVADPVAVASFTPQGEAKQVRQVAARFASPMVPFGDPRELAPFDVDCPAGGQGRWVDATTWVYDFERDLPAGTRCTFALKEGLVA